MPQFFRRWLEKFAWSGLDRAGLGFFAGSPSRRGRARSSLSSTLLSRFKSHQKKSGSGHKRKSHSILILLISGLLRTFSFHIMFIPSLGNPRNSLLWEAVIFWRFLELIFKKILLIIVVILDIVMGLIWRSLSLRSLELFLEDWHWWAWRKSAWEHVQVREEITLRRRSFSKVFYSGTCGPMDPRNVWSSLITPLRSTLASLFHHFHQGKDTHHNQHLIGCPTRLHLSFVLGSLYWSSIFRTQVREECSKAIS